MPKARVPQKDLLLNYMACQDAWEAYRTESTARSQCFTEFTEWVIGINRSNTIPTPTAVTNLLKLITHPNRPSLYGDEDLRARLISNSCRRTFRVSTGINRSQRKDKRVRSLLTVIFSRRIVIPFHTLINPFFAEIGTERVRGKGANPKPFDTKVSTSFEQLLYIGSVVFLASSKADARKRRSDSAQSIVLKKRKLSPSISPESETTTVATSTLTGVPGLKALSDHTGQRIGFAIQTVVEGWNTFAIHLGFEGIEQMILPYARIQLPSCQFEVIPNRSYGFVRASQALEYGVNVSLTNEKEETFPHVTERPDEVDSSIRIVALDFLKDISSAIISSELYTKTENQFWPYLQSFNQPGLSLPDRFKTYSKAITDVICSFMQTETGNEPLLLTIPPPEQNAEREEDKDVNMPVEPIDEPLIESSDTLTSNEGLGNVQGSDTIGAEEKNQLDTIRESMQNSFFLYDCSFQNLLDINLSIGEMEIEETVQLVITDPPYNVRQDRQLPNSDHDVLGEQDMSQFVDLVAKLLRPGGHAIIFCTIQQFPVWEGFFRSKKDAFDNNSFMVSPTPIVFAYHPSVSKTFPGRNSYSLQNSTEFAIHVKKSGLSAQEEAKLVNYQCFNYVASTYAAFRNIINNVMNLQPGERLMGIIDGTSGGKKRIVRPEQKSVALLQELISRFSKPGDIVVDPFAGTFSTAIACFSLPEHRKFVGCERDVACFELAQQYVVKMFAAAIAQKKTDINVRGDALDACNAIMQKFETSRAAQLLRRWTAPPGLPPYQTIPDHVLGFIASTTGSRSIRETCSNVPLAEWPRQYRALLEQADMEALLLVDATANNLMIAPSTIKHPNVGRGVFANKTFQEGDVVAAYYGTLVYHDLLKRKTVRKLYGEGVMGVNIDRFRKFALQIITSGNAFARVREFSNEEKAVFIVPAPFCVAAYINDYHYIENDEEFSLFEAKLLLNPRQKNVMFWQRGRDVTSVRSLREYDITIVRATKLINPGEELFLDYHRDLP